MSTSFEQGTDEFQLLLDASTSSRSLSVNQLKICVKRLVAGFRAIGVSTGDRVLVNAFNDVG
jgi:non-ribosomal peptide synthetase component E (peptide arylation enzyme)